MMAQRFSISERSGEWVKAEAQKKQKQRDTESEGGGEAMTEGGVGKAEEA